MPRREYKLTLPCASGTGCRETLTYRYDTQREHAASARWYKNHPWKCSRHENPAGWLHPGNETAAAVMTATAGPSRGRRDPGLYWHAEGKTSGSGLWHGPGLFADANDFPEGARLVITVQVLPPEGEAPGA